MHPGEEVACEQVFGRISIGQAEGDGAGNG
jgi:hypothetical protein